MREATRAEIEQQRVIRVIVNSTGADPNMLTAEAYFFRDLCLGSLAMLAIVTNLEMEFGLEISPEEMEDFETVGDVFKYVADHRDCREPSPRSQLFSPAFIKNRSRFLPRSR